MSSAAGFSLLLVERRSLRSDLDRFPLGAPTGETEFPTSEKEFPTGEKRFRLCAANDRATCKYYWCDSQHASAGGWRGVTVSIGASVQVPCSAVKATGPADRDSEQMYIGYTVCVGGESEKQCISCPSTTWLVPWYPYRSASRPLCFIVCARRLRASRVGPRRRGPLSLSPSQYIRRPRVPS